MRGIPRGGSGPPPNQSLTEPPSPSRAGRHGAPRDRDYGDGGTHDGDGPDTRAGGAALRSRQDDVDAGNPKRTPERQSPRRWRLPDKRRGVRTFPLATVAETGDAAHRATHDATAAFEAEINGLRQIGELLRRELDDVREDRDRWRGQAERLALGPPNAYSERDSQRDREAAVVATARGLIVEARRPRRDGCPIPALSARANRSVICSARPKPGLCFNTSPCRKRNPQARLGG